MQSLDPIPALDIVRHLRDVRIGGTYVPTVADPAKHLPKLPTTTPAQPFAEVLRGKMNPTQPVEFSRHAIDRIAERGIPMGKAQLERLNVGIDRAAAKGSQTAAVLLDETALVVSVNNRKVITAVPVSQLKDGILTQIDSVLFV